MKNRLGVSLVVVLAGWTETSVAFVQQVYSPLKRHSHTAGSRSSSQLKLGLDLTDLTNSNYLNNFQHGFTLAAEAAKAATPATSKQDMLQAALGGSVIMGSIVLLIFAWDRAIEFFRRQVPVSLKPTVESIFATLSGLGVIGVFIGSVLGIPAVERSLEGLSKDWFGKKDILVQNFEFFHEAFLQLGVVFLVSVVAMILKGLSKLNDIDEIQDAIIDQETGYRVTAEKLVNYYTVREFNRPQENPGYTGIARELFMDNNEWSAKILMLRNLVMDLVPALPPDFRVEALIEESFAQNMFRAVQIPYLAWTFIIPGLAIANSIDLSKGVLNSGAINAAASAGEFIDTFAIFTPAISAIIITSIWSYWNCWKMTQIKYMILPKLEPDPANGGAPVIRAPPIYSDYLRETFNSSPRTLQRVEAGWAKPPRTAYDELFGEIGSAGLDFYGNSIKYQAWLNLSIITFLGIHIIPRDLELILGMAGAKPAEPTLVSLELFTYSLFFTISIIQLTFVTPRTFWNYCIIAAMEDQNLQYLLDVAGYGIAGEFPIRTVSSLRSRQGRLPSIGGERAARMPSPRTLEPTFRNNNPRFRDEGIRRNPVGGRYRLDDTRPPGLQRRLPGGSLMDDYTGQDNYRNY